MIVRELLTKIGFLFDQGAFNRSERGLLKLAGVAGATAGVVGGLTYALWRSVQAADRAGQAAYVGAQRFGVTAEEFQKLGYVADESGSNVDTLATSLKFLQKSAYLASKGGKEQTAVFAGLGIRVKDTHGKLKPTVALFKETADKVAALKDPAAQTALAMKIFGRGASLLIPVLKKGSEGITELMGEAEALGFVLSNEDVEKVHNFHNALHRMESAINGVSLRLGVKLIPIVQRVVESVTQWFITNRQLIDRGLDALVFVVDKVVSGLSAMARFIGENKVFFIAFTAAALMPAVKGLTLMGYQMAKNLVLAAISAAPFLALAAVIAFVTDEIYHFVTDGKSLLGSFVNVFDKPIKPGDTWIVKVLKTAAFYIREVNKEFRDAGGFFQSMNNVKEGLKQDLGLNPPKSTFDPTAGPVSKTNGEQLMNWLGFSDYKIPRGDIQNYHAPIQGMRAPTNDELINMGMGPVTIGNITVQTSIAPGTSPTETAEMVKQGVLQAAGEASRQAGEPRGVR